MRDVTMRYPGAPEPVLRDVGLTVSAGQIVPLLGGNGAGKTTLLKIVCGLVAPGAGAVTVAGHDIGTRTRAARAALGVSLYPERSFYFRLTCRQNLRYYGSLRGLFGAACRAEIDRVLGLTGLTALSDVPFMRLSLGRRKRLGLARSLLGRPGLLLLDEPTANLDESGVDDLYEVLEAFRAAGGAVLFSTHHVRDLTLARQGYARIHDGRLVHTTPEPATVPSRRVDVAADLTGVDLAPLEMRYRVRRTGDGIAVWVPVDVGLPALVGALAGIGVSPSRIADEPGLVGPAAGASR